MSSKVLNSFLSGFIKAATLSTALSSLASSINLPASLVKYPAIGMNSILASPPSLPTNLQLGLTNAIPKSVSVLNQPWKLNAQKLVDKAIYLAEGGAKTRHPYGVLNKFQHTTPRQASLNTVLNVYKDFQNRGGGTEDQFMKMLTNQYAPLGVKNDPHNLNKNWYHNVKSIYDRP